MFCCRRREKLVTDHTESNNIKSKRLFRGLLLGGWEVALESWRTSLTEKENALGDGKIDGCL
jgi:hypothetical protein